jgi:hypothetical protein
MDSFIIGSSQKAKRWRKKGLHFMKSQLQVRLVKVKIFNNKRKQHEYCLVSGDKTFKNLES